MFRPIFVLAILTASSLVDADDLRFASVFTNHAVLQRDIPVPVWGTAKPNTRVVVEFAAREQATTSDGNGAWLVKLDPMPASAKPRTLTVSSGDDRVTLNDVLVGEVWLASGQSNMGLAISRATGGMEAIANVNLPRFRMFRVKQRPSFEHQANVQGEWMVCSTDTFATDASGRVRRFDFSAVGFFFGRNLLETLDVPIGVIGSYVGGSPLEAWTSEATLDAYPMSNPTNRQSRTETWKRLYSMRRARKDLPQAMQRHAKELAAWEKELADRNAAHRADLAAYAKAVKAARTANRPLPARPLPGKLSRRPLEPDRYPHHATVLFNGMLEPLIPYGIRGVIWYQGEANCYPRRAAEYGELFPMMITDWRQRWGQAPFPFLYVQLPNLSTARDDWMTLRESQRRTLSLPGTGMVTAIDIGDPNDLHPANKQPVADRLALLARNIAYNERIVSVGPMIESATRSHDRTIRLTFKHVSSGLMTGTVTNGFRATPTNGPLGGFETAGRDHVFHPADATIVGNTVILRAAEQAGDPVTVRYAWAPNPVPAANLYNREGLPASPFAIAVSD